MHQVVQNSSSTTFPLMEPLLNFSPAVVVALKRGAGSLALLAAVSCAKTQPAKIALTKKISRRAGSERNRAASTRGVRIMRKNVILQHAFWQMDDVPELPVTRPSRAYSFRYELSWLGRRPQRDASRK